MIQSKVYKGIEYIQISDLSLNEQLAIREWLTLDTIIKIQTESELLTECVQYKDYTYWVENVLSKQATQKATVKSKGSIINRFGLAIDN
ncbi:hypothetical protein [Fulvivirga lutimaris]|uniref:hypothetical protein n=1 Tax=Fulvivirga lutimaris TaxID=1819566 RepID=UPI0012BCB63B|nr:hypothetical protein [Fulvivirga lutimaris]MTI39035.1 hypothetical protein [Fulvivirga lutimaris]